MCLSTVHAWSFSLLIFVCIPSDCLGVLVHTNIHYISACPSVYLPVYEKYICRYVWLSFCLCVCWFLYLSVDACRYNCTRSTCNIYIFCLSVFLFMYLSIYTCLYIPVCLSIFLISRLPGCWNFTSLNWAGIWRKLFDVFGQRMEKSGREHAIPSK